MSETPNPYSAQARGAAQIAAEAQQLADAYTSGLAGIESQTAHGQNQQLIAELLHRQAYRTRTGTTYLTPVKTRVEVSEVPTWEPDPEPQSSPIRLFHNGAVVERAPAAPEPEIDPGRAEYLAEKAQMQAWREAMEDRRYHTSDEVQAYQRAQNIFTDNWRLRERTGRLHLGPGEGRPMPAAPTRKEQR